MADKVLINLATGMEDGERVLVAFLVATAAQAQGKEGCLGDQGCGTPWFTRRDVGVVCNDCPPLERLAEQFADAGGELWLCPICSLPATSARPRRFRTRRSQGRRRCWSGPVATRLSSATDGLTPAKGPDFHIRPLVGMRHLDERRR